MASFEYPVEQQSHEQGKLSVRQHLVQYFPFEQRSNNKDDAVVTSLSSQLQPAVVTQPGPSPISKLQIFGSGPKPKVLIFAVVMIIAMGVQLFLPSLICVIPGLILALVGRSLLDLKKDEHTMRAINSISICCNVAGLIFYMVFIVCLLFSLVISYGERKSKS